MGRCVRSKISKVPVIDVLVSTEPPAIWMGHLTASTASAWSDIEASENLKFVNHVYSG